MLSAGINQPVLPEQEIPERNGISGAERSQRHGQLGLGDQSLDHLAETYVVTDQRVESALMTGTPDPGQRGGR